MAAMKPTPPPAAPPNAAPRPLDGRSLALRRSIVRAFAASRRGHLGSAFSVVELLRVLYDDVLRVDPAAPRDPDRDRLVFSKGHACLALYALLADKGFFPEAELDRFCKPGGILGGHPEYGKVPGVEASTGSLGHGLSLAVGMALAVRADRRAARVFALVSDGECDEGSVWEAALSAAKHRLDGLTVLLDYNRMQSYGSTAEVLDLEPFADKWRAFGFAVREADGHDPAALRAALAPLPFAPGRPSLLVCHTVKGRGVPFLENNAAWHHKINATDAEIAAIGAALGVA